MASPLDLSKTPRPAGATSKGWDPLMDQAKPSPRQIPTPNGAGTISGGSSVLNQPIVTPGAAGGAGSVGNGYKPFRTTGG